MAGRLIVLLYCWLQLFSVTAQISESRQPQTRNIGPATFYYRIAPNGASVLCTFLWNDSLIGLTNLNNDTPGVSWSYGSGKQRGKCVLQLRTPAHSGDSAALLLQLLPGTATGTTSYSGALVSWISDAAATHAADSVVYQLTPTVIVVTKPLGTARNNASVTIYSGPLLMYAVTLTQTAPFVTCTTELALGDFTISEGMQFTLQIPGTLQQGSIRMKATFSTPTIPSTSINAFVATWDP